MNWSVFPSTHYVLMPRGSFGIAGFSYGRVYKTDHGEFVEPKSSGLLQWSQVQMETLRHQYNATGFKVSDFEAEKGIATYVHAHVIFSLKEQAGQSVWRYGIVTAFDGPAMTLTVLLTIGGDDVLIPFRNARHVDMVAYVLRPFDGVSTNGYPVDDVIKRRPPKSPTKSSHAWTPRAPRHGSFTRRKSFC
ncbi:hypothetical protein SDRG_11543 [Saprolegnia diclina VS20]|uniref:Uncharacterized protein n=1 Tax=Saprolegnia diclina (strain VS20) TaxID=1156394 RepID=T0RLE1_SAPDV|nr:hypothetical protein SDRG_11543 [Saprolegnia diclina VS20]EQC30782.1 hypothetical protein SDRG_11543 [Saprolegnia diclina VS20]|eukprot:XP_008615806.1 hypothetical protein SDRG_11543 [Saprolegnia diclina VS20]